MYVLMVYVKGEGLMVRILKSRSRKRLEDYAKAREAEQAGEDLNDHELDWSLYRIEEYVDIPEI